MAAPVVWSDPAPVKVACVGGSLTWGFWEDLVIARKTYPDQLQILLGPGYVVRNYGVGATTAGRYPGYESQAYLYQGENTGMKQWRPDILISGLGVNDCNATWANPVKYEAGYRELIADWKGGGRNPQLFMWNRISPDFRGPLGVAAYPGNVFSPNYVFVTADNGMPTYRPLVQARADTLCEELGIGKIDCYTQLANQPQWGGEGLHLSEVGLKRLAEINFAQVFPSTLMPRLVEACPTPGAGSPNDESGQKQPWIELFNPHSQAICLDGIAIDCGAGTTRHEFAEYTVLSPGERRIVFLSGKNLRQPAKPLHANFTTDGSEHEIRLISRTNEVTDVIGWKNWYVNGSLGRADAITSRVIGTDAPHQRLVTASPPAGWTQREFDAAGWTSGSGGTGYELAARSESQFAWRWNCDSAPPAFWKPTPAGGQIAYDDPGFMSMRGTDPSIIAGLSYWYYDSDASWTAETRLRIEDNGQPNDGFVIRGGSQYAGGGYGYLFVEKDKTLFGYPRSSAKVLSNERNDDGFHVFRVAYHAPTRRFFVWRDGVEISSQCGGLYKDASRYNWLTMGAASTTSTRQIQAVIDYASIDRSGAYAPQALNTYAPAASPDQLPLTTDATESQPGGGDATLLVRIPFNSPTEQSVKMKLNVEFDDGFRAWINGVLVAECNAPNSGLAAPVARDDSRGIDAVSMDISEFASAIQPGNNVLAVQGFNSAAADSRCFVRATLDLSSAALETARYYSPPTAATTNGTGSPLPAQGYLGSGQPPGGSQLLALDIDSDLDGRSNLLEYSQGTNLVAADNAPALEAVQGFVNFLWRNNPEVGWRLMESSDQTTWRPARTNGVATATPSGTPQMLSISQPVLGTGLSYRLAAVEEPTLATWQQRYFTAAEISGGILTAPDADPDQDGWPNFLEFAIASNPRSGKQEVFKAAPDGRAVRISDPGVSRGAGWYLQTSTDLGQWQAVLHPDIRCLIDPQSGRYMLEAADPDSSGPKTYLRTIFTQSAP